MVIFPRYYTLALSFLLFPACQLDQRELSTGDDGTGSGGKDLGLGGLGGDTNGGDGDHNGDGGTPSTGGNGALAKLAIVTPELDELFINVPFIESLEVKENVDQVKWKVTAGDLPQGMSLTEDGSLKGRPVEAGEFSITVRASASGYKSTEFTLSFSVMTRSWIAYETIERSENRYSLVISDLATPVATTHTLELSDPGQDSYVRQYSFSPNGRWFAYITSTSEAPSDCHVKIVDLTSKGTKKGVKLSESYASCWNPPVWSPNGRLLAFEERLKNGRSAPLAARLGDEEPELLRLEDVDYESLTSTAWASNDLFMWGAPTKTDYQLYGADVASTSLMGARALSSLSALSHTNQKTQRISGDGADGILVYDIDNEWSTTIPFQNTDGTTAYPRRIEPKLNWVCDEEESDGFRFVNIYRTEDFRNPAPTPFLQLEETILSEKPMRRLYFGGRDNHEYVAGIGLENKTLWKAELVADAKTSEVTLPAETCVPQHDGRNWLSCRIQSSSATQLYVHDLEGTSPFQPILPDNAFGSLTESWLAPTQDRLLIAATHIKSARTEIAVIDLPDSGADARLLKVTPPVDPAATQAHAFRSVWTGDGMYVSYVMLREIEEGLFSEAVFATKVTPDVGVPRNISGTNNVCFASVSGEGDNCKRIRASPVAQPPAP